MSNISPKLHYELMANAFHQQFKRGAYGWLTETLGLQVKL